MWYRVFGTNDIEPTPGALESHLRKCAREVECHFQGDDQGWFQAQLIVDGTHIQVERFLVSEEGIRAELNTWAAWVETAIEGQVQESLMKHLISTRQIILLRETAWKNVDDFCAVLARITDGVYQVDGQGFFDQDGTLLVQE